MLVAPFISWITNERRATPNGIIWGAALWEMPFLPAAALFLAYVQ